LDFDGRLLDLLDLPLILGPDSSDPPNAKSWSPDDDDELENEKKPLVFFECRFRRFADGAVKKDVNPFGLELRLLRGPRTCRWSGDFDFRLLPPAADF
jgi:hypothetical protein